MLKNPGSDPKAIGACLRLVAEARDGLALNGGVSNSGEP